MSKEYTPEEIKNRLSNIGEAIGNSALERIAELEKKISILLSCKNCPDNKGGYICQKEYEDKCLAQKIQFIKELKKENTELKEESDFYNKERGNYKAMYLKEILKKNKAKEIIKKYLAIGVGGKITQNYLDVTKEAEQFISEVEK